MTNATTGRRSRDENGGFADFVRVPKANVFGLWRRHVRLGANALIDGAGTTGLLIRQSLKSGNAAHVTVVDTKPEKLELARRLGANETIVAAPARTAVCARSLRSASTR